MIDYEKLKAIAKKRLPEAVRLTCDLVRIKSLSGEEGEAAFIVRQLMERYGYDEARIDEAGNVIGLVRGSGQGRTVMFNCHLDTVDCGDVSQWRHGPFSAAIDEERIWGLGASDTKGALACQVVALGALVEEGLRPAGPVYVTAVVHEESSGFGSTYLAPKLPADIVIIGEASDNTLKLGHRGRLQFDIHFQGKSAHASNPDGAVNPHYSTARLLLALEQLKLERDPLFGSSRLTPTLYVTDRTTSNVTPGEVVLSLDCRNIPQDSEADLRAVLERLLESALQPPVTAQIELKMRHVTCYTGLVGQALAGEPSFATEREHPVVVTARDLLETAFGHGVPVGFCGFATDGGHYYCHGSQVLIFSPAEEDKCHTAMDSVAIDKMEEAILGNMALALGLSAATL